MHKFGCQSKGTVSDASQKQHLSLTYYQHCQVIQDKREETW